MSDTQPPDEAYTKQFTEGYALVLEGLCPLCRGGLERRIGCGLCPQCQTGWAASRSQGHEMFKDGELILTRFTELADEARPLPASTRYEQERP